MLTLAIFWYIVYIGRCYCSRVWGTQVLREGSRRVKGRPIRGWRAGETGFALPWPCVTIAPTYSVIGIRY